jgi:hypothetical protein
VIELLYWLTSVILLAFVVLLVAHRPIGQWAERATATLQRWTVAIDAITARLESEEWDDATWREVLKGRRRQ